MLTTFSCIYENILVIHRFWYFVLNVACFRCMCTVLSPSDRFDLRCGSHEFGKLLLPAVPQMVSGKFRSLQRGKWNRIMTLLASVFQTTVSKCQEWDFKSGTLERFFTFDCDGNLSRLIQSSLCGIAFVLKDILRYHDEKKKFLKTAFEQKVRPSLLLESIHSFLLTDFLAKNESVDAVELSASKELCHSIYNLVRTEVSSRPH